MKKKFYCLLFKDEKKYGIPLAPQGLDTLFGEEVKPVVIPDGCTFTIPKGEFAPFHNSNTCAHFVSEDLKDVGLGGCCCVYCGFGGCFCVVFDL